MIHFKALMQAIQKSLNHAVQVVGDEALKRIGAYFEPVPNPPPEQAHLATTSVRNRFVVQKTFGKVVKFYFQLNRQRNTCDLLPPQRWP